MTTMDLRTLATYWSDVAEQNKAALGDGWTLADEFVRLHLVGTDALLRATQGKMTASDEASIMLLCQGADLFSAITIDIARGWFGVSALLMRAMLDTQSLFYACASQEDLARLFLKGIIYETSQSPLDEV